MVMAYRHQFSVSWEAVCKVLTTVLTAVMQCGRFSVQGELRAGTLLLTCMKELLVCEKTKYSVRLKQSYDVNRKKTTLRAHRRAG